MPPNGVGRLDSDDVRCLRNGASRARTDDLRAASATLSQLSYSPENCQPSYNGRPEQDAGIDRAPGRAPRAGRVGRVAAGTRSPARDELRNVEVLTRIVAAAPGGIRPDLVQTRGHAAVGQTHVAEQALGVVAQ